jgi:hypothetical protein
MSNFNILTEKDNQISQPKFVNIDLMLHQKTIIHKMLEIEEGGIINISTPKFKNNNMINGKIKSCQIQTNFAVLSDKVGAGKTLEIASLISVKKVIKDTFYRFILHICIININIFYDLSIMQ